MKGTKREWKQRHKNLWALTLHLLRIIKYFFINHI